MGRYPCIVVLQFFHLYAIILIMDDRSGEHIALPPTQDDIAERHRLPDFRKAALGVFAGLVIAANVFGGPPAAAVPPNTVPVNPYVYMQSVDEQNTAVVTQSATCSASIIRDEHDKPVAALTAEHCGFYDQATLAPAISVYGRPWIRSADGQDYIVLGNGLQDIYTGADHGSLKQAGAITEVIVSRNGETDQALLVFAGHTPEEAIRDYNASVLHQDAFSFNAGPNPLVPGASTVYVSGWPYEQMGVRQMGSHYGDPERQDFEATFIQYGSVDTFTGESMNAMWLAFPRNDDGATCSPGISGSSGRVVRLMPDGAQETIVGVVSVGDSIDSPSVRSIVRAHPEIDWSRYASLCALAPNTLRADNVTVLKVVPSISEIPNPQVYTESAAQNIFYDLSYRANVANGILEASVTKLAHGQEVTQTVTYENPILFVNQDGSVLVGYYDTVTGGLNVTRYDSGDELKFYAHDQSIAPGIFQTKNYTAIEPKPGDDNLGSFADVNGRRFGIRDQHVHVGAGQAYSLARIAGTYVLVPFLG